MQDFLSIYKIKYYLLILTWGLTSGCGNLHYLFQAGKGQLALFSHARPLVEVLKDERTPPRIKKLLGEIEHIKKFGELYGIKPTNNYQDYVKLDRNSAVYVVSACEPLHFKAKEWSFPVVGSFPYLGWFDLEDAKKYASQLKKEGWDVDLRGASAYSTLGWFRDAILSSMIPEGEEALGELVNVVIHESVHATLYINGQSFFNESLASFVAEQLTSHYLNQTPRVTSSQKVAYEESEKRSHQIQENFHQAYQELSALYSSAQSESEKLKEKFKILSDLQEKFHFKRDITNATLIQYKTYNSGYPDFEMLFEKCKKNWTGFFSALKKLKPVNFPKAQQGDFREIFELLAKESCQ